MSSFDLVVKLFLQLVVILAVSRAAGWVGRFFGQTQVVSEMVAGVLLGPSLFGLVAPHGQQWLFPTTATIGGTTIAHPSMAILYALSQLGLVLYMFLVGLEFDTSLIRGRVRSAALISSSGIIVPLLLGGALAVIVRGRADLFSPSVSTGMAALYMGAAMSITAFPMLARILYERGISRTRIGTITLAAGSIDDALAWCLLAVILATVQSSPSVAWLAIGGGVAFSLLMLTGGRRLFRRFAVAPSNDLSVTTATLVLLCIMLSAWVTDVIGIYAVFGAFVCGVCMPRGRFADLLQERFGVLTGSLLVPIFFVYSGLNTRVALLVSPQLWALTAVVIAIAIVGKGVACALAARVSGEPWRESWTIGTLMNARGLMELIILNIGLEKGLITPTLFTVMVVMAIVTTLMASPLFQLLYGRHMTTRPIIAG